MNENPPSNPLESSKPSGQQLPGQPTVKVGVAPPRSGAATASATGQTPPRQEKPSLLMNLVGLSRRARRAEDALSLEFILVNETFSLAPYTLAMLWVESEGVVSISAVSQVDRHSAFNLWVSRVCGSFWEKFQEPTRIEASMLPAEDLLEWSGALPAHALWIPAGSGSLQHFGLLLARNDEWKDEEIALLSEWVDIWRHAWQKLHAPTLQGELTKIWTKVRAAIPDRTEIESFARDTIAGARHVVKNPQLLRPLLSYPHLYASQAIAWGQRHGFRGGYDELRRHAQEIWNDKRRRYIWLFWIAVFFPVRLTVLAPGELVPANPAIIRVPIEGVVDEFFVQPNQKVVEGQPLFKMDLTSLTSRFQVAQQETQIASTELRQSTLQSLSDSKSRRMIAPQEGKAAERRLEADYLRELLSKAQIKAPRAGVVLFDDPSEWIGKPVVAGEKIMVVANEGQVEIEAWIPISDIIELPDSASVTLYLNASPLSPADGTLRYLGHEALQRPDGTYAYRLRATLDPGESGRRVGLKGTARVSGQFVPLSFWVFRKPLAWLRQFLGV